MNLNRVELCGGMTRNPELKYFDSGMAVCDVSVALNGTRYDSASRAQIVTTTYVSVNAYGWVAEEFVNTGAKQGDEVYVLGELDQREVEKRDGTKEKKTRVNASILTLTRHRTSTPAAAMQPGATPPGSPGDPWTAGAPAGPRYDEPPF